MKKASTLYRETLPRFKRRQKESVKTEWEYLEFEVAEASHDGLFSVALDRVRLHEENSRGLAKPGYITSMDLSGRVVVSWRVLQSP